MMEFGDGDPLSRSMPSLILHIGTAKTGTTSIQQFLSENRQALASRGFFVPSFLGVGPNHRWLPLLAQDELTVDGFTSRQGLDISPERLREGRAAMRLELQQAAATTGEATWIISSEQLQSRLTTVDLLRLRRLLEPLFSEIRVLVYLRQPLPTAISAWSTRIRSGRGTSTLPSPQSCENLCDHASTLRQWQQVFGRSQLVVRLFPASERDGGSLLEDFSACTGIGDLSGLALPSHANPSLSFQAIKVLWQLQQRLGDAPTWRWRELVGFVERSLRSFPVYLPTVQERECFAAQYAASEQWVCREFFPERAHLWDHAALPVRQEGDLRFQNSLSDEESALVAMLAELWCDRCAPRA
jgi:hypothetical protein